VQLLWQGTVAHCYRFFLSEGGNDTTRLSFCSSCHSRHSHLTCPIAMGLVTEVVHVSAKYHPVKS